MSAGALHFVVPGMHCAGCMAKVERALKKEPGVRAARANLSTKRVSVETSGADKTRLLAALGRAGFDAAPFDPRLVTRDDALRDRELMRALGVAGFAAANIMILSVAVWAGFDGEMKPATRDLMHWIAAVIALPATVYAGRPFFRSALGAVRRGGMNMDVPIALAVILACAASLMETIRGGPHVYFDASVSLLFFLLIGRVLDRRMRGRATAAAQNLLQLRATEAVRVGEDGVKTPTPVEALEPGDRVFVAKGMRVPADGVVEEGTSHLDAALITGETTPEEAAPGARVFAGAINLAGPLLVRVSARDEESLLAEIVALMEGAEARKGAYVRAADRIVRWYAPGVHILAGLTFAGWMIAGAGWHPALMAAIAVLIVTCPCALGLAVPVVQVAAAGGLMRRGVLVKTGDAFERLAGVDHVVFDKTGTLTGGALALDGRPDLDDCAWARACALGGMSAHPLGKALAREGAASPALAVSDAVEHPGLGVEATVDGVRARLGSAAWTGAPTETADASSRAGPEVWYAQDGAAPVRIGFVDPIRADARATVTALKAMGLSVELLSGDHEGAVTAAAFNAGIETWRAGVRPDEKIARIEALRAEGARVLMVGDGINDAPALAAAHASMSPAAASDIAQTTADVVFQGADLAPVTATIRAARAARARMGENFALALGYNIIAVPLAAAGFVTPLIAAILMSSSSILVTLNALRLRVGGGETVRGADA